MSISNYLLLSIAGASLMSTLAPNLASAQSEPLRRLLQASEAEQVAWINSYLRAGMPPSDEFGPLAGSKPDIVLPLLERKIEEVLRSPSSPDNFNDRSVDPQRFVALAASAIVYRGNVQSLRQASKLIKLDEKRFGYLVDRTLWQARDFGNPFAVAYEGFEIGDPAIDSRIAAWVEVQLAEKRPPQRNFGPRIPEPVPEGEIRKVRTWWAEAMVDKYGGVPSEAQWRSDPIVSRLKPSETDPVHDEMIRRTVEIVEKRAKR
jgi:hypothetical protein